MVVTTCTAKFVSNFFGFPAPETRNPKPETLILSADCVSGRYPINLFKSETTNPDPTPLRRHEGIYEMGIRNKKLKFIEHEPEWEMELCVAGPLPILDP